MTTSWTTRSVPSTSWGTRTLPTTSIAYDNTYVYDAALIYDAFITGTTWTTRITP